MAAVSSTSIDVYKTKIKDIFITPLKNLSTKHTHSFCWTEFGQLAVEFNGKRRAVLSEQVFVEFAYEMQKMKTRIVCFSKAQVKAYSKGIATSNLLRHLKDAHGVEDTQRSQPSSITQFFSPRTPTTSSSSKRSSNKWSLSRDLALWFARSLIPFDSVENDAMIDFLKKYNIIVSADDLPSRHNIAREGLEDVYKQAPRVEAAASAAQNDLLSFIEEFAEHVEDEDSDSTDSESESTEIPERALSSRKHLQPPPTIKTSTSTRWHSVLMMLKSISNSANPSPEHLQPYGGDVLQYWRDKKTCMPSLYCSRTINLKYTCYKHTERERSSPQLDYVKVEAEFASCRCLGYFCTVFWSVRAVMMLSDMLNLPMEYNDVKFLQLEQKSPQFKKLNPMGTVPVLQDGDFTISESHAIMKYLLSKYGGDKRELLYPSDVRTRAVVDQCMFFNAGVFFSAFMSIGAEAVVPRCAYSATLDLMRATFTGGIFTPSPQHIQDMESSYSVLDAYLQNRPYVATDRLTLADLAVGSTAFTAQVLVKTDADKFPRCTDWMSRLHEEEVFKNVMVPGVAYFSKVINKLWEHNKSKLEKK
ncbi:unnamed protein product [Spodoptera exigua]|nr:unnamed protein product [Spodoptera exigua]